MTRELLNLLRSDIFTDAPEYAERVARVRQIVGDIELADESLAHEARELYASDDLEIDPDPETSRGDDGVWVRAWVWVPDSDLCPHGKCRGDCTQCEDWQWVQDAPEGGAL